MRKPLFILLGLSFLFSCDQAKKRVISEKDANYEKAKSFFAHQTDSAFYYFNQVAIAAKDSLQTSYAYNYMAFIQSEAGDYFGAQENLTMSLRFLDTLKRENWKALTSTYNELGLANLSLKNYSAATRFFEKAVQYGKHGKYEFIALNNKALALQKQTKFSEALHIYKNIIPQIRDQETFARVLSNQARTAWLNRPTYNAAPEFMKALQIRQQIGDNWGMNTSYAHLADFYMATKPDSALIFATKMHSVAQMLNSPDDELEALDKLMRLSAAGKFRTYFPRYRYLNDSLQTARNAAKNQFALIRFEVKKKESDNLRLQKENSERKYQVVLRNVMLFIGAVTFILLTGIALFWYRKRKKLQEEEKQLAVQETNRKASKKVHDTLANDIYRIMKKLQHEPEIDKAWLLDNIDDVYKRSRDISYDIVQNSDDRFQEKIAELLKSFATETTQVVLAGNDEELWKKVNPAYKFELKYVLQELMVNMQKHSSASNVVIKFEAKDAHIQITYFDNGIGLAPVTVHKNGLQNTGNRINGIGGQITFDSGAGEGLTIQIILPTA